MRVEWTTRSGVTQSIEPLEGYGMQGSRSGVSCMHGTLTARALPEAGDPRDQVHEETPRWSSRQRPHSS